MSEERKNPLLRPAAELRRALPRRGPRAPRVLAALTAIFLAASAALLFPAREQKTTNTPAQKAESSFTQLIPAGAGTPVAARVEAQGEAYTLRAGEDGSFALSAAALSIDAAAARRVLSCGASLLARQRIDAQDTAAFGLDPARVSASFTYADGRTLTLHLGDAPATGEGRYAQVEGTDGVYVVNRAVYETLSAGAKALAALPDLTMFQAETLLRAAVTPRGGETVSVARVTEANPFNTVAEMTEPIRYPASSERAAELFLAVCGLEIERYTGRAEGKEALSAYGLDAPLFTLHLLGAGGETLDAQVGEADGALYARLDEGDVVYALSRDAARIPEIARVTYLAEQLPGLVSLADVKTLTLRRGGETHRLSVERTQTGEARYWVDDEAVELEDFRPYYQAAIGLLIDRRLGEGQQPGACRASFTYTFTDGTEWALRFLDCGDTYDAVERDGEAAFLIARQKVDAVFERFAGEE